LELNDIKFLGLQINIILSRKTYLPKTHIYLNYALHVLPWGHWNLMCHNRCWNQLLFVLPFSNVLWHFVLGSFRK